MLGILNIAFAHSVMVLDHLDEPAETEWLDELALSLPPTTPSGAPFIVTETPPPGFVETPLTQQLSVVRPLLESEGVNALAWLKADADVLHLSVAFVESNRAVIRVVDAPRDADAPARLALAARELLQQALELPELPDRPVAPPPTAMRAGPRYALLVGVTSPIARSSGGPRGALDFEISAPTGPFRLGGSLGVSANGHHFRGVPRLLARYHAIYVALGIDIARLEWVTWLQPRIELGASLDLLVDSPITLEPRIRLTPLRDQVISGQRIYDSGWVEFGLHFGLALEKKRPMRQISTP